MHKLIGLNKKRVCMCDAKLMRISFEISRKNYLLPRGYQFQRLSNA